MTFAKFAISHAFPALNAASGLNNRRMGGGLSGKSVLKYCVDGWYAARCMYDELYQNSSTDVV